MRGHILLEGGSEFGGKMAEPDTRALELAGGLDALVSIIPAAAFPDRNHEHAGQNGVRWFRQLGARNVTLLPLVDQASANQLSVADALRKSRLIYLLGGFPHYLAQTLNGSAGWQAMREAHKRGAVVGGSSAGAMIVCGLYFDPDTQRIWEGLNLVPRVFLVPHHNTFGKGWLSSLAPTFPHDVIVGVDEQTGMIDDGAEGEWTVLGKGVVTVYEERETRTYHSGETFSL